MPYYAPFYRPYYQNSQNPQIVENNQFSPQQQMPQQQMPMQAPIQPPMMPMQPQPIQFGQQNAPTSDMIWVQGEAGAKAYLVAPGNTATLWDSERNTIYVKSCDLNGIPSMKVLDFSERDLATPPKQHECQCGKNFVKIDEFNALKAQFDELYDKMEALAAKKQQKAPKGDAE